MNITEFTVDPDLILQPKLTGRKNQSLTRGAPDSWLQTVFSWADIRLTAQDAGELLLSDPWGGKCWPVYVFWWWGEAELLGKTHTDRERQHSRPGVAGSNPALCCVRVSIFYLDGKIIRMWCCREKEEKRITFLYKRIQHRPWPMRYRIWIHERSQRLVFTAYFLPIFSHFESNQWCAFQPVRRK